MNSVGEPVAGGRSVRRRVEELGGATDLHARFMRPASGGLAVQGWAEPAARILASRRAEVRDAAGESVASGSASMRLRR